MFEKLTPFESEDEIKSFWKYKDKVYVSIICTCYNQEQYIEDALKSFLAQESEYAFEIIIHDDASTDSTSQIISIYRDKYPSLIKLIQQKENQYSQGDSKVELIAAKESVGKYIALCEGDDYWVDKLKIQKQLLVLLEHSEIKICFTPVYISENEQCVGTAATHFDNICVIPITKVISGGGAYMPTPSLIFDREVILKAPEWFKVAPVGDLYLQILGSLPNGAIYMSDVTAVYRAFSQGSWNRARKKFNKDKVLRDVYLHETCLRALESNYPKYKDEFKFVISRQKYIASLQLLSKGETKLARQLIEESWCEKPNISVQHNRLFKFRAILPLLRCLILLKKFLEEKIFKVYISK